MPFFRRSNPTSTPREPPRERLPGGSPSQIMNVLGRELNAVLPQERIIEVRSQLVNTAPTTPNHEKLRAFMALDWFARTWVPRWSSLIPGAGEELASALADLPPIRNLLTAEAAGNLIMSLSHAPDQAAKTLETNYNEDNFYDMTAVIAARGASAKAVTNSTGDAIADGAASVILDECLVARTDVALSVASAISLLHSLDGVWPYIREWANGPGDFDAKQISIRNLAPYAAEETLEPTVKSLQRAACQLYVELSQLG